MQASQSHQELDFPALLAVLQEWLGSDLCLVAHHPGAQFNLGFCARLEWIRSPQDTGQAAVLDFDGARSATLAPGEAIVHLHTVRGSRGSAEWIEARLDFGLVVTIERIP